MLIVTEPEYFNFLTERVKETPIECIDENIREIHVLLNSIPGIATAWSCESHPENVSDRFYISSGVTEEGLINLYSLFEKLHVALIDSDNVDNLVPKLSLVKLFKQTSLEAIHQGILENVHWNSWNLECLLDVESKPIFISRLTQVLKDLKEELLID